MTALFVANVELNENEGIYKKVLAEATAIGTILGSCDLITKYHGKAKVQNDRGVRTETEQPLLTYLYDRLRKEEIGFLYIRHMIPSPKLISVLRLAKKQGVIVYYEIPTYPYFGEQFKASRKKYRAVAKLVLDLVFWPLIYRYIDQLVVIRSSTKAKRYQKMIEITNGVRVDNIKSKSYDHSDPSVFRMVTVGTLYPYHGYDRILKGMAECSEQIETCKVEFHVIGSSQTIDELQDMSKKLNLKNVFFHGMKSTEELNEMYEQFDVGLGCLALHRRNADIDTTLKVVEYYCRGLPVISSGKCPMEDDRFTHVIDSADDAIDMKDLYNFYRNLNADDLKLISPMAKRQFSWDSIMRTCLKKVKE